MTTSNWSIPADLADAVPGMPFLKTPGVRITTNAGGNHRVAIYFQAEQRPQPDAAPRLTEIVEACRADQQAVTARADLAKLESRIAGFREQVAEADRKLANVAAKREDPGLIDAADLGVKLGKLDRETADLTRVKSEALSAVDLLERKIPALHYAAKAATKAAVDAAAERAVAAAVQRRTAAITALEKAAGAALDELIQADAACNALRGGEVITAAAEASGLFAA